MWLIKTELVQAVGRARLLRYDCTVKLYESLSKHYLLNILDCDGCLYRNNSGLAAKISVQVNGNKSKRSSWIAIRRSFMESPLYLPVIEESCSIDKNIKPMLLGNDILMKSIYLPIGSPEVNNNHIGLTGDSGMGKSYTTLSIVNELSKQEISSVIIDSENSFAENTLEKAFISSMGENLERINVYENKIPINIFERQKFYLSSKVYDEKDSDIAARSSHLLGRACKLSEKQINAVYRAVIRLLDYTGDEVITLMVLCDELEEDSSEEADVAKGRILQIATADVFREDGTSFSRCRHFEAGKCLIFSLAGFQSDLLKRMIAECILQDLWSYAKNHGAKDNPFAVVIDEIEIIPPTRNSTFANLLTLGRKFGVMCIRNTTLIKGKFDDYELVNLNQTATRLFFKTSDPDEHRYIEQCLKNYK